ncbi:RHS repeat-associated core domain-containing protein [Reichenbachiella sp. MALMAid0571]|uniref:RHS repeat-associated core domain-containing protein n=1 Tax=Reichenbachiella sp. MALMAid0571 TaxID=3143939 RepID=UPI0032DE8404
MKGRDFVSEVNYSLEVKEGDKLELDVNVFFVEDDNDEVFPGLMGFLASSFGVSNGIGSETAHIYDGLENASGLLALSLTNSSNAPRAYLMCMVFDQDYVLIDPTTGGYDFYAPVPEAAATETQNISLEIDIPENAKYIYTYVANESAGTNVFFDDFTVKQLGVDITQTTDYYPFGSVLSHWQKEVYRFGYQGQFAEEDEETGFNAFELRAFDSNIGRWMAPDPYRQFASPYNGMGNNPVYLIDRNGGCAGDDIDCINAAKAAGFTSNSDIAAYQNLERLGVEDSRWGFFDELLFRLNEGGGGFVYYGDNSAGWPDEVRAGFASDIIENPTEGLVVFKELNSKVPKFQFDNRTPITKSNYKKLLDLMGDGKFLFESGGKVVEVTLDPNKANEILRNAISTHNGINRYPVGQGAMMRPGGIAGGGNILGPDSLLYEFRTTFSDGTVARDTFEIE